MQSIILSAFALALFASSVWPAVIDTGDGGSLLHFGFHTENGHTRSEDIKYNNTESVKDDKDNDVIQQKPVEYRGGYSFVSADGYEYTVLYKANKNGFQPYVTAHKIKK